MQADGPARPLTTKAAAKWGTLSAVWAALMDERRAHNPRASGLALTRTGRNARAPALRRLLSQCDEAGYGLPDLVAAVGWLMTSDHFRARAAREASDPVMALLRHGVDYVELARDGAAAAAVVPLRPDATRPPDRRTEAMRLIAARMAALREDDPPLRLLPAGDP